MIRLTRLNHTPVILNSDLIEIVEVTPDTVITLTTGQKLMVRESADEVTEKVRAYRRSLLNGIVCPAAGSGPTEALPAALSGRPQGPLRAREDGSAAPPDGSC